MSCFQSAGQQLSVNDLPVVMEQLNDTRAKWYDIGLQLRMSVGTLDAIKKDCNSTSDCLRETLTTWLKTCPSPPTWSNILGALRTSTVAEVRLAADLEQKYCSTQNKCITATHHYASPAPPSQADTQTTSPQQSQSQAHVPLPVPPSQAHTLTPLPPQSTVSPTQPPVFASSSYSVSPPSHPQPWSTPYYYSPHTGYPLYTPFPLTPPTSGVATASVHSQVPQDTHTSLLPSLPTSSRPFLPSVPTQPTTPQFSTTLPQYPSPPSLTTIPPSTSPILLLATVTTSPDLPARHTLGMKIPCSSQPLLCSI